MDTVNKYEEVSKYFPLEEWKNLPEYEKNRFYNLLINYNKMCELGLSPRKPDFMLPKINKTRIQKLQKESDEEWTPNKAKRPRWNPPRKLAREVPSVEQKIEDQPFVQFTAADVSRSQQIYQCLLQKIAELRKQLGFEDVPEYQLPTQHRYPRRQIERKDYREKEVPDDDDYIYCDECEREWEGDCPEHGALVNVPDTKVPDTVKGPDRAEKTVPKELCIAQSSIHNAGKGVWTRVLLQKGLRFGPYEGVKVDSPNGEGYCWQIRRNQRISHYVDAWDSSKSNWMRYVNCARHEEEQNLIAFQYKGEMYYRTFRTIRAHVELLVWYGDDFGRELGIDKENYHKPLRAPLKSSIFPCTSCNTTYCSPVYLHNHFRYCRMRTSTPRECLGAPSGNKSIENERVCPCQFNTCKCFGNNKRVSFINSGSKMNKKRSKSEENGTLQLLRTEKKCVERIKNDFLSCVDIGGKSRGIPSKCAKIISLTESVDRRELKYVRDPLITSGGPKDSVDILMMRKNITSYIYPGERNFNCNDSYRPHSPSGSSVLGTKLDECSPPWNMLDLNFTLHKHRNICKTYKNISLNSNVLQTNKPRSIPSLPVINPFTIPESVLSAKCNESRMLLPVKSGIRKCDNIHCIMTYYERQRSHASNTSLNAFEWPCNCKQCNKVRVIVSKLHIKERQSAVDACGIPPKSRNQEFLEIHERSHSSEKLPVHNAYREMSAEDDSSAMEKHASYTGEDSGTLNELNLQTNSVLIHHTKINPSKTPYVCKLCNKKFLQNETLVQHYSVNSGEGVEVCYICSKTSLKKDYNVKETLESDEWPYECKLCKMGFHSSASLVYPSKVKTSERPYQCTVCRMRFLPESDHASHSRVHSVDTPFECSERHKNIRADSNVSLHVRTHSSEKVCRCSVCNNRFRSREISHHQRNHPADRIYQCTICYHAFSSCRNQSTHRQPHISEMPYQCSICNMALTQPLDLSLHPAIHSSHKLYQSTMCNKAFSQPPTLSSHKRMHTDKESYQCTICDKPFSRSSELSRHHEAFSDSSALSRHRTNQTGEKPYQCTICNKAFSNSSQLSTHRRIHIGDRPYQCTICNKAFSNSSHLSTHHRFHTGERPYQCTICNKAFSDPSYLPRHRRIHTGERPYQCTICNKAFSDPSYVSRHRRIHTGEKPYQCTICNKAFSNSSHLTTHRRIHIGEKPYQCTICNKAFCRSFELSRHRRIHTGEKPYQCTICNKAFSDSSHLSRHRRIHTGEKSYQCTICNKAFSNSSHLSAHRRIHTGERPYHCTICNKAFSDSSNISKHRRIHTGEKPYQCTICNKAFTQAAHLSKHRSTHTADMPYRCSICDNAFSQKKTLSKHLGTHR